MSRTRVQIWAASLAAVCLATACTPAMEPTPAATPSPSATPTASFVERNRAFYILNRLVAASGSNKLLKLRITVDSAEIAVVTPSGAQTWAWRGGGPTQVDGDTRDVGQARFNLSDFRYDNLIDLFETAAAISGSRQAQELQVVEYNAGQIYLTVTTTPETSTVFFRPDGTLVPRLDFTDHEDLKAALADVVGDSRRLYRWGINQDLGMYADSATATGRLVRRVRKPRFPVREDSVPLPTPEQQFDASALNLDLIAEDMDRVREGPQGRLTCEVKYLPQFNQPVVRMESEHKTAYFLFDGDDVTSEVK